MPGKATLIFGLMFWTFLQAQDLTYSRVFPSIPKNLPIFIQNTQHDYFYVLRYNRKAHDLTLERRAKPSAEILSFTPLKLDSVNSDLYNYASMDYLLFEHKRGLYFVFEKNLNSKKSIFFKHIDSLGKAGGFKEVCSLTLESTMLDFDIELAGAYGAKLLILSTQKYLNQTTKKTIILYDLESKSEIWAKTLPLENSLTGYSKGFCLSEQNDLFYVMVKAQIVSYKRKYIKHAQVMVPTFYYDSLHLIKFSTAGNRLQKQFLVSDLSALHGLKLHCDSNEVRVLAQAAIKQNDNTRTIVLFNYSCNVDLTSAGRIETTPISPDVKRRLTYYDGTDYKDAADKEFDLVDEYFGRQYTYILTERKEGGVYKELLLWQIQNSNGKVFNHYLIPRRMLSSETWSRYTDIGEAGSALSKSNYYLFLAEAAANVTIDPNTASYYQLKKKASLSHCYLIVYTPGQNGVISKRKLHQNLGFDFIPIDYSAPETGDLVFYFSNGKQEKFAVLNFLQP